MICGQPLKHSVSGMPRKKRASQFEEFMRSPLLTRVEVKVLSKMRRLRNDPDWLPSGFPEDGGLVFYSFVWKLMERIYRMRKNRQKKVRKRARDKAPISHRPTKLM
jgi:hypothetical protein